MEHEENAQSGFNKVRKDGDAEGSNYAEGVRNVDESGKEGDNGE